MKSPNHCHLTIQTYIAGGRIVKEARELAVSGTQIIIAPGDGGTINQAGIRIVSYRYKPPLMRVFACYLIALKLRARVYHLHDPELLILGWCFRLFTSAAVIYDAHRPTFHYFLWKFGPTNTKLRFKASILKLIEMIGVIFIDGLIVAAPQSLKGIGRFCPRKIIVRDYPDVVQPEERSYSGSAGNLIYRGLIEKRADLNLILETFFQVQLTLPETTLILASPVPDGFDPVLIGRLKEIKLVDQVIIADKTAWKHSSTQWSIGLATPNRDDFFQRSEQPEIYEYLTNGIPVICGRSRFTEQIVAENETGIVMEKLDPLKLSETTIKLFSDKRLLTQMSKNARQLNNQRFSWNANGIELNKFIDSMFPR